jgi:hypothetical protein
MMFLRSEVSGCVKQELSALFEFRSARFICATCYKGINEKNGMTEYEFLKGKGFSRKKLHTTLRVTVVKAVRVYEFDREYTVHRLCQIFSWHWLCVVSLRTKK